MGIESLPVQYYVPEVPVWFLREKCPVEERFSRFLEVDYSLIKKEKADYVISVSLFNKDVGDVTGFSPSSCPDWNTKYLESLESNLRKIATFDRDYAVELWCEPSCVSLIKDLVDELDYVNLHVMALESNAATGHFWRFMGFDTDRAKMAKWTYVLDIDMDWAYSLSLMDGREPCSAVLMMRGYSALVKNEKPLFLKYTPMCAAFVASNPSLHGFSVNEMICRFWYYQVQIQYSHEDRTPYNAPFGQMFAGFGNTWNLYHSCERFLGKVFYYEQKRKGALNTIFMPEAFSDPLPPEKADMDFSEQYGNTNYSA